MARLMLHVRIDNDVKKQAIQGAAGNGLSMLDPGRRFLCRMATDQALPRYAIGRVRQRLEGGQSQAGGWATARRKHG